MPSESRANGSAPRRVTRSSSLRRLGPTQQYRPSIPLPPRLNRAMTILLAPVVHLHQPDEDEAEYILTPITLWPLGTIGSVHVLPGPLDLDRFQTAVGVAAGRMRGVAGRYGRRSKGDSYEYFVSRSSAVAPLFPRLKVGSSPLRSSSDHAHGRTDPDQLHSRARRTCPRRMRGRCSRRPRALHRRH